MLHTLDAYNESRFEDDSRSYQRLAEIFKFAYAKRSLLGDPHFIDVEEVGIVSVEYCQSSGAAARTESLRSHKALG